MPASRRGCGAAARSTLSSGWPISYLRIPAWIFGKKVMIPADLVWDIDPDTETLFVNRTKDEIKNAPEFDETRYHDPGYRNELGRYYNRGTMPPQPGR
jgi:hypothetical protein